ncbi:uncharacterized protein G2W53_001077 [Senna tora]|uniref:Uncharacterized protein n=1 Tax=Senna tora TaxID=362788 RepID=A0A835CM86_9FABA|nr:uncharacterized protein G2W53_001077 [Senna tora]
MVPKRAMAVAKTMPWEEEARGDARSSEGGFGYVASEEELNERLMMNP